MGTVLGVFRQYKDEETIRAVLLALLPDNIFKGIHKARLRHMKYRFRGFHEFLVKIEKEFSVKELKYKTGGIEWIVLTRKNGQKETYYCSIGGLFAYVYIKLHIGKYTVNEAVRKFPGEKTNSVEELQKTRTICEEIVGRLLGNKTRNWLFEEILKEFDDNKFVPEKMWKLISLDHFKKNVKFALDDCKTFMNANKLRKILWQYKGHKHGSDYELDFYSFMSYVRKYCEIYLKATPENRILMDMKDWEADTIVGRFKELERICEEFGQPAVRKSPISEREIGRVFADFYSAKTPLRSTSYAAAHLWKHGLGSNFHEWKDLEKLRDAYFAIPQEIVSEFNKKMDCSNNYERKRKRDYNYTFPICSQYMTVHSGSEKNADLLQVVSLIKPDGTMFVKTIIKGPPLDKQKKCYNLPRTLSSG